MHGIDVFHVHFILNVQYKNACNIYSNFCLYHDIVSMQTTEYLFIIIIAMINLRIYIEMQIMYGSSDCVVVKLLARMKGDGGGSSPGFAITILDMG